MCACVCVPVGGQVVQTGSDVMSIVVHLFAVEGALHLQAAESLMELLKLRPPALAVQTLLTDVLKATKTCVRQSEAPHAVYCYGSCWWSCRHLGDHLQDLVLGLRWNQNSKALQTTKTPQDLPLLLLQAQVAIGDQRLVPLHLLRCSSILPSAALHQPIMTHFLWSRKRDD